MAIIYLTKADLEVICAELTKFFLAIKDPPPIYVQSQFDKIDSVLSTPQRTFDGQDLYPTIYEKAACYLYFINKFHPFDNGNKRLSIVTTVVFLKLNNMEFTADVTAMYQFAKKVTNSHRDQKQEFSEVVKFIRTHSRGRDY